MKYFRLFAVTIIGVMVLFQCLYGISYGDDATVLPKGRWRILVDDQLFFPIDQRYNKDGKVEDIGKDFNVGLNSDVFSDLSLVEAGFGMPAGSATLGKSAVSFKWEINEVTLQPAYGVTDSLSIGINIPYRQQKNKVTAALDASGATVGKNATINSLAPLAVPGTVPLTTEDIQNLLGKGLDINGDGAIDVNGFSFKRFETWSESGIGDVEAGARYQYFNSDTWRLAFTGGLRFPTGKTDDPDSLVDRGLGTGAYALLFRLHQDLVRQPSGAARSLGIPDPGALTINTTFRYDLYLPDKQEVRICNVHEPICNTKADVERNLGDIVEAELSGSLGILKGLYFSPLYKYGHSFKDHYSGHKELNAETDWSDQIYKLSLSYTTVPLYLEHKFPLPLVASLSYRDRFAGTNNVFKSQFIGFTLASYF